MEKLNKKNDYQELTDDELNEVTGGGFAEVVDNIGSRINKTYDPLKQTSNVPNNQDNK